MRGVPSVRKVLLRHGEDKPIWLSEFGWHTASIRDVTTWKNGVNEETQARYIEQLLLQVKQWPYVPVAIIYELQDESADRTDRNSNFGLLRYDGTFKPAFEAFHRGALALSDRGRPNHSIRTGRAACALGSSGMSGACMPAVWASPAAWRACASTVTSVASGASRVARRTPPR